MKTWKVISLLASVGIALGAFNIATAADAAKSPSKADMKAQRNPAQHRGGREEHEPRARGIPQHGSEHHIGRRGEPSVHHQVFHEARPLGDIRRDPHIVMFNHANWHPAGHWENWYRPDWAGYWRITDWSAIRAVTCEAVNNETGELFPVTENRADSWYWNSDLVNNVAARALDECVSENGNPESCTLVDGECWNSIY